MMATYNLKCQLKYVIIDYVMISYILWVYGRRSPAFLVFGRPESASPT